MVVVMVNQVLLELEVLMVVLVGVQLQVQVALVHLIKVLMEEMVEVEILAVEEVVALVKSVLLVD
jgi:hypothetical protein